MHRYAPNVRAENLRALFAREPFVVDSYGVVRISVAAASPTERHGGVQQDDGHVPEAKPAPDTARQLQGVMIRTYSK